MLLEKLQRSWHLLKHKLILAALCRQPSAIYPACVDLYILPSCTSPGNMLDRCWLLCAGSFGAMDPASNDLYMFLEKLQQQQKEVVALIKQRQKIISEREGTSPAALPQASPAAGAASSPIASTISPTGTHHLS